MFKGINAPFWFKDTMLNTIDYRECEKALQLGKIYNPKEAYSVKLIDQLVDSKELLVKAEEQMKLWCRIPGILQNLIINNLQY